VSQQFILPANRPDDRDRIAGNMARFVALLPADRAWSIEIKEHRKRRSDQQNRYLWGAVYPIFTAALDGWTAEDVHEYFLGEHFGWERLEGFGRVRLRPVRRSSRLTTLEFAEFVAFIQQKGAELGLYVPDPNEFEMRAAA
jgi:hypothetical protein